MASDRTSGFDRRAAWRLEQFHREAVLVHRCFPPHSGPPTNSKFGGLPNLPDHHEWPRTSEGVPLHFLAQIDCSEIPFESALPSRGVLFFFARDDEEQIWGFWGNDQDDCRVIHSLDASAHKTLRAPPPELPPIGGNYGRSNYGQPSIRIFPKDSPGPNLHVEWPVQLFRIQTWPDSSAFPRDDAVETETRSLLRNLQSILRGEPREPQRPSLSWAFDLHYDDLRDAQSQAEIERVTGKALMPRDRNTSTAGRQIFGDPDCDHPFPPHWIYVHHFGRIVLNRYRRTGQKPSLANSAADSIARDWLRQSETVSLETPLPDSLRREFRAWVKDLWLPPYDAWDAHQKRAAKLSPEAADWILGAATWAVRTWAHDRSLSKLIPPSVYGATEPHLSVNFASPTVDREGRPTIVRDFQFAQMLGYASRSQTARRIDDPAVCLLTLRSDMGVPWLFADVGECTFWISEADLSKRNFDSVSLSIDGG